MGPEIDFAPPGLDPRTEHVLMRSAFDSVRRPLAVLDDALRVRMANQEFLDAFDVTRDHAIGRGLAELAERPGLGAIAERLATVFQDGVPLEQLEMSVDFSARGARTILVSAQELGPIGPGERALLMSVEDISERRTIETKLAWHVAEVERSNRELDAAQARTASILESIGDGFAALDGNWKITYVNSAAAEMVESTVAALLGDGLWERFPHLAGGQVEAAFRTAMAERRHIYIEGYSPPFNRWRGYDIWPWQDGVALYLRDITERRTAAEAQARLAETLEGERTLFREVLKQLPIGVVIADFPSGELKSANAEVERIWRRPFRPSRDIAAYAEWEAFHPDGSPYAPHDRPLARTFRTGYPVNGEDVRIRRGDGSSGAVRINSGLVRDSHGATIAGVVTLEDVTDRVQADDAIRFQAQLLDTVEQAIIATDLAGAITLWNRHAEKLYGWTPAEAVGRNLLDIGLGPRETIAAVMTDSREGRSWRGEMWLRTKTGEQLPAYVGTTPILDRQGRIVGSVGISFDVTERRKAEEALRDREQRLARIVEVQQEVAASVLDQQRLIGLAVERARSLTGATGAAVEMLENDRLVYRAITGAGSQFIGRTMDVHASLSGRCILEADTLLAEDAEHDDRVDHAKAREAGVGSMICSPLIHEGRATGVLKVYSDRPRHFQPSDVHTLQVIAGIVAAGLTQAKAVNALSTREAHFRSLIENAADPVMTLDAEGRITYVSPSIERVLGCPPDQLLGSHSGVLAHPDERERARETLGRLIAQPLQPVVAEFRAQNANGAWRSLRLTARNLLHDPIVAGIVVNVHDVTEEKLMAQQLRQAQKLEAVGQLAGGIAHDFNNLLTVISGHSDFLASGLDRRDARFDDVHEIRRASDRAAALTRQLLAFSRQQMLQPKIVDLNAIVAGLQRMLRRLIGEDIQFTTRGSAEPAMVLADPGQLEQVIMNLAINARDAMPGGGQLTIEVTPLVVDRTHIAQMSPGRYVTLTVTDTGTGMTKEVREHVFDPFFTTKEAGKGTGLGLSTVYGIVKQSGGYICVDSEPGHGSTFRVHLPFADERAQGQTLPPLPAPNGGSETILLVEDEEPVRRVATRILRQYGYRVIEAPDGRSAIDMLRETGASIDLIITDIVMPHMSGRELVDQVTQLRGPTPALYISGYTNDEILRRSALDPGGIRLLQKPFTTHGLAAAAREAIAGQRSVDAA